MLVGLVDKFNEPACDYTRQKAQEIAEYMRMYGVFEPHRSPLEDMEYTMLPKATDRLKERFESIV